MSLPTLHSTQRSLSPWYRRGPFSMFRDEIEDFAQRLWGDDEWSANVLAPPLDIRESDGNLQVSMDLPGVDPKEIEIEVSGNRLQITGERKEEKEEKGERYHRVERLAGRFSRSVELPCAISEDKVDASYHDGVLQIKLAKCEEAKAKRIEVKSK